MVTGKKEKEGGKRKSEKRKVKKNTELHESHAKRRLRQPDLDASDFQSDLSKVGFLLA
jgi:hypothetical protein